MLVECFSQSKCYIITICTGWGGCCFFTVIKVAVASISDKYFPLESPKNTLSALRAPNAMGKDIMDTMILMYERLSAADNNGLFNESFFLPSPVTSNEVREVVLACRGEIKDRVPAICRCNGFDCGIITAFVVEQPETQIETTIKRKKTNIVSVLHFL